CVRCACSNADSVLAGDDRTTAGARSAPTRRCRLVEGFAWISRAEPLISRYRRPPPPPTAPPPPRGAPNLQSELVEHPGDGVVDDVVDRAGVIVEGGQGRHHESAHARKRQHVFHVGAV